MIRSLSPPGRFLRKEVAVGGRGGPSGRRGRAEEASEEVSATATAAAVAAEVIDGAAADAEASAGEYSFVGYVHVHTVIWIYMIGVRVRCDTQRVNRPIVMHCL